MYQRNNSEEYSVLFTINHESTRSVSSSCLRYELSIPKSEFRLFSVMDERTKAGCAAAANLRSPTKLHFSGVVDRYQKAHSNEVPAAESIKTEVASLLVGDPGGGRAAVPNVLYSTYQATAQSCVLSPMIGRV